jgi:hypothetical protein
MYLYSGSFNQIFSAFTINKISGYDGGILLCPGNNMHFGFRQGCKGFCQGSIIVGDATFKLGAGSKADDFFHEIDSMPKLKNKFPCSRDKNSIE